MQLTNRWTQTWQRLGKTPPGDLYTGLCNYYTEPPRAYHTLQHIEESLVLFASVRHLAENPADVEEFAKLAHQEKLLKITHHELAAELGTAREVVSRHLKRFESYGWLRLNRGIVEIINREALENISE